MNSWQVARVQNPSAASGRIAVNAHEYWCASGSLVRGLSVENHYNTTMLAALFGVHAHSSVPALKVRSRSNTTKSSIDGV